MTVDFFPDFADEDELQAWLKKRFEDAGWTARREVNPHSSNYLADLIVHHPDYDWIGIETKFIRPNDSIRRFGRALEQITQQYRGKTYSGNKITLWVLAPYFKSHSKSREGTPKFTRELFNYFGIGYLRLSGRYIKLDFAYSNTDTKIFIADVTPYDNNEAGKREQYGDIDAIYNSVDPKIGRLTNER